MFPKGQAAQPTKLSNGTTLNDTELLTNWLKSNNRFSFHDNQEDDHEDLSKLEPPNEDTFLDAQAGLPSPSRSERRASLLRCPHSWSSPTLSLRFNLSYNPNHELSMPERNPASPVRSTITTGNSAPMHDHK